MKYESILRFFLFFLFAKVYFIGLDLLFDFFTQTAPLYPHTS